MVLLNKGERIWVLHPTHGWASATVVQHRVAEKKVDVVLDESEENATVSENDIFTAVNHEHSLKEVEDMVKMNDLHEGPMLHNLAQRYKKDNIYTYVSTILVSVNPFKTLPTVYTQEQMARYKDVPFGDPSLPPHVYAIAERAFSQLRLKSGKNQAICVTGESGAGKTEVAKFLVQYLSYRSAGQGRLECQLIEADPLLESFGNAKTVRNDNSSRFGKFIKIYFSADTVVGDELVDLHIVGAEIDTYLLEKSRICKVGRDERTYHIFYQLLAGASEAERREWRLPPANSNLREMNYLSQNGTNMCFTIPSVDDAEKFHRVRNSMDILGISQETQRDIFRVLSAILHLGNITFTADAKDHSTVSAGAGQAALEAAAELLGASVVALRQFLTSRSFSATSRVSVYTIPLTAAQAADMRDALAKEIYNRLFNFIVAKINERLNLTRASEAVNFSQTGGESLVKFVGVLDIYGFEVFERNSFEQLCINLANERLQQTFLDELFRNEQREYQQEFSSSPEHRELFELFAVSRERDNGGVLELLEKKPFGIFPLLDEECVVPKGTDSTLLQKLVAKHKPHQAFFVPRPLPAAQGAAAPATAAAAASPGLFGVRHFAGDVAYDIDGFLEKNRDTLNGDIASVLGKSSFPFIRSLFADLAAAATPASAAASSPPASPSPTVRARVAAAGAAAKTTPAAAGSPNPNPGANKVTLGTQFRQQLQALATTLSTTSTHYIRCIKPNQDKVPNRFVRSFVLHQLRCVGLLETVKARRAGFAARWDYEAFCQRYGVVLDERARQAVVAAANPRARAEALLRAIDALPPLAPPANGNARRGPAAASQSQDTTTPQLPQWALGNSKVFLRAEKSRELEERRERWLKEEIERERKRREEEERRRKEEEARRRKEEEERKRREEEERRKREAEEKRRKEEEERKRKLEEERKRKEEEDRKKREIEEKRRKEEEERKRKEEEERKRKEEEERKRKEEEERKRKEEEERKRKENEAEEERKRKPLAESTNGAVGRARPPPPTRIRDHTTGMSPPDSTGRKRSLSAGSGEEMAAAAQQALAAVDQSRLVGQLSPRGVTASHPAMRGTPVRPPPAGGTPPPRPVRPTRPATDNTGAPAASSIAPSTARTGGWNWSKASSAANITVTGPPAPANGAAAATSPQPIPPRRALGSSYAAFNNNGSAPDSFALGASRIGTPTGDLSPRDGPAAPAATASAPAAATASAPAAATASADDAAKQQRLRDSVVKELIDTERQYVSDLGTILDVFLFPLRIQNAATEPELAVLFGNVELLANVNREMLKELEELLEKESASYAIGSVFIKMSAYLRMYTSYCSNQDAALQLMAELRARNEKFAKTIAICETDPRCKGIGLGGFLIKPVQRICKYPLLLRELLKHTPENLPEYSLIEGAFKKISETVDYINEKKRTFESNQQILELQNSIEGLEGEIVAPSRTLVKEGDLQFRESKSSYYIVRVFLFNDLILFAKPKRAGEESTPAAGASGGYRFAYRGQARLEDAKLTITATEQKSKKNAPPAEPGKEQLKHGFEITHGSRKFALSTDDEEEFNNWTKQIRTIIKGFQKKRAETLKRTQVKGLKQKISGGA